MIYRFIPNGHGKVFFISLGAIFPSVRKGEKDEVPCVTNEEVGE